jgi:hypothetical protein
VLDFEWLEEPIQALSTCYRDGHILVGNNRGELALFDLRQATKGFFPLKICENTISQKT